MAQYGNTSGQPPRYESDSSAQKWVATVEWTVEGDWVSDCATYKRDAQLDRTQQSAGHLVGVLHQRAATHRHTRPDARNLRLRASGFGRGIFCFSAWWFFPFSLKAWTWGTEMGGGIWGEFRGGDLGGTWGEGGGQWGTLGKRCWGTLFF